MDIERVLRGTPATVVQTFYGGETPLDADGSVTYTIKNPDGTTYLSGTALHEGAAGSGSYKVTIPGQTNLTSFEVIWSGSFSSNVVTLSSYVEVVGGFYFTLSEIRNYDNALANTTRFPTEKLIEKRHEVESEFEDICQRAFVPRFHREQFDWTGEDYIRTEMAEVFNITKITVDGADRMSYVSADLIRRDKDDPHILHLYDDALELTYSDNVVIEYEYGMQRLPLPVKQAAKKRARGLLLGMNATIDERATVMSIPDFGTFNLASPGPAYTGIPEVDAVLHRYMLGFGAAGAY